jgi:hypothetical protein
MSIGEPNNNEYLQLKIDGVEFLKNQANITRPSVEYCCQNLHAGGPNCDPNNEVSWPIIGEYYSATHTASSLTFSIVTNINEAINKAGYLLRDLRIYLDECDISCSQCNGKN